MKLPTPPFCFCPCCSETPFEQTEKEKGRSNCYGNLPTTERTEGAAPIPGQQRQEKGPGLSSDSGVCKESLCFRKMNLLILEDPRHTSRGVALKGVSLTDRQTGQGPWESKAGGW